MGHEGMKYSLVTRELIADSTEAMALGASTNSLLHLPAIARECGLNIDLDTANRISDRTPNICRLAPAGSHYMEDLDRAGGIAAVMHEINRLHLLHTDCLTCSGQTVGENIRSHDVLDRGIIRSVDSPYSAAGGIAVLKGNLAPEGCVVKRSAVSPAMMYHRGPAQVFEGEEEALDAILHHHIQPGDVVVIRYEGPKGGPGMREMLNPTSAIMGSGLGESATGGSQETSRTPEGTPPAAATQKVHRSEPRQATTVQAASSTPPA